MVLTLVLAGALVIVAAIFGVCERGLNGRVFAQRR